MFSHYSLQVRPQFKCPVRPSFARRVSVQDGYGVAHDLAQLCLTMRDSMASYFYAVSDGQEAVGGQSRLVLLLGDREAVLHAPVASRRDPQHPDRRSQALDFLGLHRARAEWGHKDWLGLDVPLQALPAMHQHPLGRTKKRPEPIDVAGYPACFALLCTCLGGPGTSETILVSLDLTRTGSVHCHVLPA